MSQYGWDGDYNKYYLDGNDHTGRTSKLIEALKILKSLPDYVLFDTDLKDKKLQFINSNRVNENVTIENLIGYMTAHPDMIKYEFDANNKLIRIKVDPSSLFTFKHDSKVRQCDMSTYITEFLKLVLSKRTGPPIDAVMVNKDDCKSVEGHAEYEYDAAAPATDVPATAGGSKSRRRHRHRRKPARKTRHKSKSKSKTHRRRRHSRVRKYKKYTSRRK
jgi:hypothetical protein